MIDKLLQLVDHYNTIVDKMSNPDIIANIDEYTLLAKEHRQMTPTIDLAQKYINCYNQIQDDEEILKGDDLELKEIVKEEINDLKKELIALEEDLKIKLLPRDPNDDKNIILEIQSFLKNEKIKLNLPELSKLGILKEGIGGSDEKGQRISNQKATTCSTKEHRSFAQRLGRSIGY